MTYEDAVVTVCVSTLNGMCRYLLNIKGKVETPITIMNCHKLEEKYYFTVGILTLKSYYFVFAQVPT